MEKIIELLNEYEKDGLNEFETYVERWYCERTYQILSGKWENNNELKPCEIISKQYGFIERLVKNDKIDFDKVNFDEREVGMDVFSNFYKKDIVIMRLSIKDNALEYLVSILK